MLTPSLNTVMTRLLIVAAVLGTVVFFAPAIFAQVADENVIMYAENGTDAVRTFTSTDPEGSGIDWDVTGTDADDFTIDARGVLTFNSPPNYESPSDRTVQATATDLNEDGDTDDPCEAVTDATDLSTRNCYRVTVRATEQMTEGHDVRALSTETEVIVRVTDENEPGSVTMNRIQPEVGTQITAMLSDPDGTTGADASGTPSWQWYVSKVTDPLVEEDDHWILATGTGTTGSVTAAYTPAGDRVATNISNDAVSDADKYLRVVVTYFDRNGATSTASVKSMNPVRAEVTSDSDEIENPENGSPGFSSAGDYTRTVPENTAKGMPVGAPVMAIDPNSDTLTYELDNDADAANAADTSGDVGYFSIDDATGQLMVKKTLDYDANMDGYEFYVRAIDPSGETAEVMVTVMTTGTNDAPVIMGSLTAAQTDANNADNDPTNDTPTPKAAAELRANEQDSDDDSYTGAPDMLLLAEPNAGLGQPNVFTAMDEDARGQIFWSLGGDDADDFDLSSSSDDPLTGLRGPNEPIALRFKTAPDYENPTDSNMDSVYEVTLIATDSRGAADSRDITVFVDNVEEQGAVTLDEDQPLIGQPVIAMVEDPDNGVAVVTWRWERATSTAATTWSVIPGATTGTYTPVGDDNGYYLRATATYTDITSNMDVMGTTGLDERTQKDDGGTVVARTATSMDGSESDSDKVYRVTADSKNAVRVGPDPDPTVDPPQFAMSSYDRMVVENAEAGSIVGDPVRVMPESGTTFSYDLDSTVTGDDDYFSIDMATGQIRVKAVDYPDPVPPEVMANCGGTDQAGCPTMVDPALDYEGTNTFSLIVTAEDDNNPSRTTVTTVNVSLTNLNEVPYFDKATREAVAGNIMYGEQRTNAIVQLSGVEPDGHALKWEVTGADASDFMIVQADDLNDGKDRVHLMFAIDPDYENGKGSATTTVAGDTYEVVVRATEMTAVGNGPKMAAEQMVTVQVTNTKEAGMVAFDLLQPEVGTEITASVSDLDGGVTGAVWSWYRAKVANPNRNPNPDSLSSEWLQITGAAADAYTPQGVNSEASPATTVKMDEGLYLLAKAVYFDAQSRPSPATTTAVGITAYPTKANVTDVMNNSPDFNANKTTREVPENTAVGMPVGDPVDVDRNEDGDILTYSLDNDDDVQTDLVMADDDGNPTDVSFFSIDQASGQIMVKNPLSAEMTDGRNYAGADGTDGTDDDLTPGEYVLFVRATDPSGETDLEENSDEIEVTITAADVNEAPVVSGMAELTVNEADSSNNNRYVGLGSTLVDNNSPDTPDDDSDDTIVENSTDTHVYRRTEEDTVDRATWPEPIGGKDGALFEYSVHTDGISRRLHFITPPNYEDPMDTDGDNVYEVTVRAVDTGGAIGEKAVRITVMNVDETGTLTLSPEQPDDGMPVMATLTDPDGVIQITNWQWYSNSSRDRDTATPITGATMSEHTGDVGDFLWAMVEYRDGESVVDDVVTVLDERNASTTNAATAVDAHDSDRMLETGTDNAVQADPDPPGTTDPTDTAVVEIERMVYENVPSTGYAGDPIAELGDRNTIGGPDGATFEFAEEKDLAADGYYDASLVGPTVGTVTDVDDKMGQLALVPVTNLDHETKDTYIIEITDPDSAVDISTYRITFMVMDVNEAPTAPSELRGPPPALNTAPEFAATTTTRMVAENSATGTDVGMPVEATDADRGDTLTYELGGMDMASFTIDSETGQILTSDMLDYETKSEYSVTVTATDEEGESAMIYVTIMVTNVGLDSMYDMDDDGAISREEVLNAIDDYLEAAVDSPTREDILDVIDLYLGS